MDSLRKPESEQAPRRRRRKEARPAEIIEAASRLFGEKGYAATRLDEVAKQAGISKATVYVYFDNKESLFRAVARAAMASRLTDKQLESPLFDGPLAIALETFISRFLKVNEKDNIFLLVRMVVSEAHNFPDVACIWHDEVVLPIINKVADFISEAQSRGEAVAGDPYLIAFSVIGPLQMALLYQSTFSVPGDARLTPTALASQHLQILLHGLLPAANSID